MIVVYKMKTCSMRFRYYNYTPPVFHAAAKPKYYSNVSMVFYKPHSLASGGHGTVVNSRAVARRT